MVAYACRITEQNFSVIASEKPNFNKQELLEWIEEHETGFFIRDPASIFDCKYMHDDVFFEFYKFADSEKNKLFRLVFEV